MLQMITELGSHCRMFLNELSHRVTVSVSYHVWLSELTRFTSPPMAEYSQHLSSPVPLPILCISEMSKQVGLCYGELTREDSELTRPRIFETTD